MFFVAVTIFVVFLSYLTYDDLFCIDYEAFSFSVVSENDFDAIVVIINSENMNYFRNFTKSLPFLAHFSITITIF